LNLNVLVGKRVLNKRSRLIGNILAVTKSVITISFHGEVLRYPFPDAFSSFLEIEDEDLQHELEKIGSTSDFNSFRDLYERALKNEIQYLKANGGKKYKATDGERLSYQGGAFLYVFETDTDLHFQEGTPLKLSFA